MTFDTGGGGGGVAAPGPCSAAVVAHVPLPARAASSGAGGSPVALCGPLQIVPLHAREISAKSAQRRQTGASCSHGLTTTPGWAEIAGARSPMDAPSGGRTPRAGGAQAFRHMQNLERFTKEAVRLGVPAVATFEAPALLEAADMNAVVLCINALERLRLGQYTPRS